MNKYSLYVKDAWDNSNQNIFWNYMIIEMTKVIFILKSTQHIAYYVITEECIVV